VVGVLQWHVSIYSPKVGSTYLISEDEALTLSSLLADQTSYLDADTRTPHELHYQGRQEKNSSCATSKKHQDK
jgi:hypothetical protein